MWDDEGSLRKIFNMADISQYVSLAKIFEEGSATKKLCEL